MHEYTIYWIIYIKVVKKFVKIWATQMGHPKCILWSMGLTKAIRKRFQHPLKMRSHLIIGHTVPLWNFKPTRHMSKGEISWIPFSNTVTPFYLKETAWMFELVRNWLSPFFSLFPFAALLCHFWAIFRQKRSEEGRSGSLTKWDRIAAILSSPPLVKLKNKVEIELMLQ